MIFFPDPTTRAVGLDISEHVFRLVEVRRGPFYERRLRLFRYTEERIPDDILNAGEFKDAGAVTAHLRNLMRKAYGRRVTRGAVVSLPETRTFIKVITVGKPSKEEDVQKAILAEAELHIPTALSDLYVDWQHHVDPKNLAAGAPMMITIAAAPKAIVDGYSAAMEPAGLVPVAFEIEAQAIARSVIPLAQADDDRAVGIIDFGATRSSFIVYDRGTIQFSYSIPLSGDEVTRRIASTLSVTGEEAERTKRQCGVDAHKCGLKLWKIMEPFLSEMTARVRDATAFYRDHFPGGRDLSEIILCGGGANMARLDELLSDLTKQPVRRADPWVNVDPGRSPLPTEIILSSTTAVGLALRQMLPSREPAKRSAIVTPTAI